MPPLSHGSITRERAMSLGVILILDPRALSVRCVAAAGARWLVTHDRSAASFNRLARMGGGFAALVLAPITHSLRHQAVGEVDHVVRQGHPQRHAANAPC